MECKIFLVSVLALERGLRAPRFASVSFKQPMIKMARTWYSRRLHGTTSATVISRFSFAFLLLGQWFSLQSWCAQWSIGSAEGSVLPPIDENRVDDSWGYKGSIKTANLLSKQTKKAYKISIN